MFSRGRQRFFNKVTIRAPKPGMFFANGRTLIMPSNPIN